MKKNLENIYQIWSDLEPTVIAKSLKVAEEIYGLCIGCLDSQYFHKTMENEYYDGKLKFWCVERPIFREFWSFNLKKDGLYFDGKVGGNLMQHKIKKPDDIFLLFSNWPRWPQDVIEMLKFVKYELKNFKNFGYAPEHTKKIYDVCMEYFNSPNFRSYLKKGGGKFDVWKFNGSDLEILTLIDEKGLCIQKYLWPFIYAKHTDEITKPEGIIDSLGWNPHNIKKISVAGIEKIKERLKNITKTDEWSLDDRVFGSE
ncbi:MAG: hypothetical protein Q7J54_00775 [Candidatus Woesearchaeota archaeon]|nr:hypothetical protein [Candidatus Woesearchaeota archaeon]